VGLSANSGTQIMNLVILLSAIVPLGIVGILCWVFWRASHRAGTREGSSDQTRPS
jgi:hypothetical protein